MIREYLLAAKKEFIVTVDNKEIWVSKSFYEKRKQLKKKKRIKYLTIIKVCFKYQISNFDLSFFF